MTSTNKFRLVILLCGLVSLFVFYLFSREVKRGFLKQIDFNTTVRIQDKMPMRLDSTWETLALPVTPVPSIVIVGLLSLVAFVDLKKKKIRLQSIVIPLLFGLLILGEMYGKTVVHHPAPPFFMIKHPTTIFPEFYVNEQFSYPSGHTARAVFMGLVFYSVFIIHNSIFGSKKLKVLAALGITVYILLVAIGRIYLGHHWLSDIIGGGLLGLGMALSAAAFLF